MFLIKRKKTSVVQNAYSGFCNGRILSVGESCLEVKPFSSTCNSRVHGCLGLAKAYLTSAGAGAGKQLVSRKCLVDVNSVLANPRIRRLFSSESPKKRSK